MEKDCDNSKYWSNGVCMVPLYVDAEFYPGSSRGAEESCYMFEAEDWPQDADSAS